MPQDQPNPQVEKSQPPKAEASKKAKKSHLGLIHKFDRYIKSIMRFQVPIIAILIFILLAITTLRMMKYADPPIDDQKVQDNLLKVNQVRIDQKVVQRIQELQDAQVSTGANKTTGRTNPFSE